MTAPDLSEIESGGKRWHGEDHRVIHVRWEPYKPDGQRQMKAKGRWQEQVGSGDYWRWQNCDRPQNLTPATATPDPLSDPRVKALVQAGNRMANSIKGDYIHPGAATAWDAALAALAELKGQDDA